MARLWSVSLTIGMLNSNFSLVDHTASWSMAHGQAVLLLEVEDWQQRYLMLVKSSSFAE